MNIKVNILRAEGPTSHGKLADAELHFVGGELDGLKLIGFGVWVRRGGNGYNVTFPARQFTIHGERRFLALLRATGNPDAQDQVRRLIIEAYLATDRQNAADPVNA